MWSHLLLGDQGHIFRLLGTPSDALWGHLAEKGPLYLLYRFSAGYPVALPPVVADVPTVHLMAVWPDACHLPAWQLPGFEVLPQLHARETCPCGAVRTGAWGCPARAEISCSQRPSGPLPVKASGGLPKGMARVCHTPTLTQEGAIPPAFQKSDCCSPP